MEETTVLAPASKTSFDISTLNLGADDPSVYVCDTGTTVSPYPFERLKFEQGRQTRFSIITNKVVIVKRHYHDTLGYVRCNGICCQYFDKSPSIVYLYPVVVYQDTDSRGKPLSDRIQVKMLQCNKEMYNFICGLHDLKGDISSFDLVGTQIPGTDKYPKNQLLETGSALWKNNEHAVEYVMDYMKQNADKFLSSVGKLYKTEDELKEALGLTAPVQETVDQDLNDIFRPQNPQV